MGHHKLVIVNISNLSPLLLQYCVLGAGLCCAGIVVRARLCRHHLNLQQNAQVPTEMKSFYSAFPFYTPRIFYLPEIEWPDCRQFTSVPPLANRDSHLGIIVLHSCLYAVAPCKHTRFKVSSQWGWRRRRLIWISYWKEDAAVAEEIAQDMGRWPSRQPNEGRRH